MPTVQFRTAESYPKIDLRPALATAAPAFRMSVDELVGHVPTLREAARALSVLMALQ